MLNCHTKHFTKKSWLWTREKRLIVWIETNYIIIKMILKKYINLYRKVNLPAAVSEVPPQPSKYTKNTHHKFPSPFSLSSPRISCTFGFCSSRSRLREPVSGKDLRISATINTQGSESTVASWIISDRASFIWWELGDVKQRVND